MKRFLQLVLVVSRSPATRSARQRREQARSLQLLRSLSTASVLADGSSSPPSFPVTETCPELTATCKCAPAPPMPDGLEIDHQQPLNGTMAAYTQHVVVATGRRDWTSRIEDDGHSESWGALVRGLKTLIGRGGKYADPYNNIVLSNSSFVPDSNSPLHSASTFLFPSFTYVPSIPVEPSLPTPHHSQGVGLSAFVRAMLLPRELHRAHSLLPETKRAEMTRDPKLMSMFPGIVEIKHSPTILICGHGGRDMRCGIMGPSLEAEFIRSLQSRGFTTDILGSRQVDGANHANIGLISHIGGHKYAGNVIIYIPPGMATLSSCPSPLAGKGVWYGRVEPKHVEGIVEESILQGRVIADHFRGGIGMNGEIYRL